MDNKKISALFGIVVIAFLALILILIQEFKTQRANDYKDYTATVANLVRQKNDKIKVLYNKLMIAEKKNQDLRDTLADARNSLESLSKKLIQPAAVPTEAAASTK